MVFNSLTFLIFFAVVLLLHQLPLAWTIKKCNLLIASYLFYAAWNPPFVLLLILAAVVDFFLARGIDRSASLTIRRLLLGVSLMLNLGLLGYFKYGPFLLENFTQLLALANVSYRPPAPDIILPLGISFYTFETISYLVDVYNGRIKPWRSFLDYALFLTFFPHLVAGPIVRAEDFLPQCTKPRRASAAQMGWGLTLLAIGLFEKVVLADDLFAPAADQVFNHALGAGFLDAWIGAFAFSGQIYFDFAGYSTCGIGVALCLGFVLKDNFRFPYAAVGFSDFWQRWHISLSSWLRDYLYIPLGGNRKGWTRTYANLLFTMLVGGLWHGASWRFVAWGGLHGFYLVVERLLGGERLRLAGRPIRFAASLATFVLVCIPWVFFRAQSFAQAFHLLHQLVQPAYRSELLSGRQIAIIGALTTLMLLGQWLLRDSSLEEVAARLPWFGRALVLASLMVCLALSPGDDRAFIYFQF